MSAQTEQFLEALRKQVRQIRLDVGASQADLTKRSENLQQSAIARYETGSSPNVGIRTLYEISAACGVPLSEIFKQVESANGVATKLSDDEWAQLQSRVNRLPESRRKWLTKIVEDILRDPADN